MFVDAINTLARIFTLQAKQFLCKGISVHVQSGTKVATCYPGATAVTSGSETLSCKGECCSHILIDGSASHANILLKIGLKHTRLLA